MSRCPFKYILYVNGQQYNTIQYKWCWYCCIYLSARLLVAAIWFTALFSISPKCSRSCAAYISSNAVSNVLLNGNDILFSHCARMPAAIFVFNFNDTFQNNKILIEIMPVDRPITHRRRKKTAMMCKDFCRRAGLLLKMFLIIALIIQNHSKSALRTWDRPTSCSVQFQALFSHGKYDVDCICMDADSFFLTLHWF